MIIFDHCLTEIATMLPLLDYYSLSRAIESPGLACDEDCLEVCEVLAQERNGSDGDQRFRYLDILYPLLKRQKEWRLRLRYHPASFQASFDLLSHEDAVAFLLEMDHKIRYQAWRDLFFSEAMRRRRLDHHDMIVEGGTLFKNNPDYHSLMDIASDQFMIFLYMDLLQLRRTCSSLAEVLMMLKPRDIDALLTVMKPSHRLYMRLSMYQWNPYIQ